MLSLREKESRERERGTEQNLCLSLGNLCEERRECSLFARERERESREREREGQSNIFAFPWETNSFWYSVIRKRKPASPGESVASVSEGESERSLFLCLRKRERSDFLFENDRRVSLFVGERESVWFFETARELCLGTREGERDRGLPFAVSDRKLLLVTTEKRCLSLSLCFSHRDRKRALSLSLC